MTTTLNDVWDPAEVGWMLRRPPRFWTPLPAVGARVFYRHRHFADVTDARVEAHEDLDDTGDSYVWRVVTNEAGMPVTDELGRRIFRPVPDPWVTLRLRTDWGVVVCREGRLRGSAGWLPPDWARRLYPFPTPGALTFRRQMEATR